MNEDVSSVKTRDFPASHVSFGGVNTLSNVIWMLALEVRIGSSSYNPLMGGENVTPDVLGNSTLFFLGSKNILNPRNLFQISYASGVIRSFLLVVLLSQSLKNIKASLVNIDLNRFHTCEGFIFVFRVSIIICIYTYCILDMFISRVHQNTSLF